MHVIIGEDEALLRRGLQLVLEDGGLDVVAVAPDAEALEAAVDEHVPDLVVTDIRMPPTHTDEGLVPALRIREKHPATAVVVLSQHVQRRYARELLASPHGRVGYLLKQRIANVEAFLADLRSVAAGGTALDPDIVAVMLAWARHSDTAVQGLTPRQQEVLALMAEGQEQLPHRGRAIPEREGRGAAYVQHLRRPPAAPRLRLAPARARCHAVPQPGLNSP